MGDVVAIERYRRERRHELDELKLRLKGLVLVRSLLERRGATAAELDAHNVEIERVRAEIAHRTHGGSPDPSQAAA